MKMSASVKDPKRDKLQDFDRAKNEPLTNLTQEKIILLKLQKSNPEAFKLLKNYKIK